MTLFRRIILPTGFLAVLLVIAVSLAWMAFRPAESRQSDDETATGDLIATTTVVERGTVENVLTVDGVINRDVAEEVKSSHSGVLNHRYVSAGDTVHAGAELFQVQVPDVPDDSGSDAGGASDGGADAGDAGDGGASDAAGDGAGSGAATTYTYHTVKAETDGTVGAFSFDTDDEVGKGDVVTTVVPDSYTAHADLEPRDLYRLLDAPDEAEVTLESGPAPFTCTEVRVDDGGGIPRGGGGGSGDSDGTDSGSSAADDAGAGDMSDAGMDGMDDMSGAGMDASGGGESSGAGIDCTIPDDVRVFAGLSLSLSIDAGAAEDVLVVPITAVRGLTEKGTVWVIDPETGEEVETEVELGLNDGAIVEVTEGLEEGQEIAEYVPGTEGEAGEEYGEYDEDFGYVEVEG